MSYSRWCVSQKRDSVFADKQSLTTSNILRDDKQKIVSSFNAKEIDTMLDIDTTETCIYHQKLLPWSLEFGNHT